MQRDVHAMVGGAVLREVVGANLLWAIASSGLRAPVGGGIGLGLRALQAVEACAQARCGCGRVQTSDVVGCDIGVELLGSACQSRIASWESDEKAASVSSDMVVITFLTAPDRWGQYRR